MLHWRAMRRSLRPGLALLALLGAGCTEESPGIIDPTFTQGVVHESFSGSLPLLGFRFYSFTVPQRGAIEATLLSLTENGVAVSTTALLTIGAPRGTDCVGTSSIGASPGASPQLTVSVDPGVYCVRIADNGSFTAPLDFAITITRPR